MKRVILVVRDGWGYSEEVKGNAVKAAKVPNNDRYLREYPWTVLKCSGNAVGLPEGTQGGSEPGHLTIGAGRVVWQPLEDINIKIRDGDFFKNDALMLAIKNCRKHDSKLHLMGLFSDEGIHGVTQHLHALMELAKRNGVKKVFIHPFLDGRDVPERSAKEFFDRTDARIRDIGVGRIATVCGRYYAMDRDTNWDRTRKAYDLLTLGEGIKEKDPLDALEHYYKRSDKSDYYFEPVVMIDGEGKPVATIDENDSVIFWNFRSDRTRQLTYALSQDNFDKFERRKYPKVTFICMSEYDKNLKLPVAFYQHQVKNNLGQVLSKNKLKQLRIAETEKYAHVTFFFNSQIESPEPGEDRIMVPSPKVSSYDQKPEMSAMEVTEKLLPEIESGKYDFIAVNFANGDLVGHSASMEAGIKACEAVDVCVGRIVETGLGRDYVIIITGDHGNIEIMFYPNGEPCPAHGTNPVPFILISKDEKLRKAKLKKHCGLSNVAPTILEMMGLKKPPEMKGESLIEGS